MNNSSYTPSVFRSLIGIVLIVSAAYNYWNDNMLEAIWLAVLVTWTKE